MCLIIDLSYATYSCSTRDPRVRIQPWSINFRVSFLVPSFLPCFKVSLTHLYLLSVRLNFIEKISWAPLPASWRKGEKWCVIRPWAKLMWLFQKAFMPLLCPRYQGLEGERNVLHIEMVDLRNCLTVICLLV